jgi:hypothetical protein
LAFLGRGIACPVCANGPAEARGAARPGPWEGVKPREGGLLLGALREGFLEGGKGWQGAAAWGHEGVHQEGMGGLTPASVVRATALLMASRRVWMTAAERTEWAWQQCSSVVRRARCAAVSVGQGLRKSQKRPVSFS